MVPEMVRLRSQGPTGQAQPVKKFPRSAVCQVWTAAVAAVAAAAGAKDAQRLQESRVEKDGNGGRAGRAGGV